MIWTLYCQQDFVGWNVHFHTILSITGFRSTNELKCTMFVKIYIKIVLYCLIIEVKKLSLHCD